MNAKRLCFVVASPMTANAFLSGHLAALSHDHRVDLICDVDGSGLLNSLTNYVNIIPVQIRRRVSLLADVKALLRLARIFRDNRYLAVCSLTPKAGLLSLLAATIARVPLRVHVFTGQVWVTRKGLKRLILKNADRLMAMLATHILTDSPSQRDFLIAERVVPAHKIQVLADGSIGGVDSVRFHPDAAVRSQIRGELEIPDAAVLLLFVGRLNCDKGILDLAEAFSALSVSHTQVWLLMVGPDEEGMQSRVELICKASLDRVRFVGFTEFPERFMAAADIFVLPSYREGFGTSVIEAAACGLPSLASRIYGLTDAVVDGVTGLLHIPGNVPDILEKMRELVDNADLRGKQGLAARERAVQQFSQTRVVEAMRSFFARIF